MHPNSTDSSDRTELPDLYVSLSYTQRSHLHLAAEVEDPDGRDGARALCGCEVSDMTFERVDSETQLPSLCRRCSKSYGRLQQGKSIEAQDRRYESEGDR